MPIFSLILLIGQREGSNSTSSKSFNMHNGLTRHGNNSEKGEEQRRTREENCEEREARGLRRCSYLCAASFVQGERTRANVLVLIARERESRKRAKKRDGREENENIASSRFATRPIDRHRHLTFVTVAHRFPFLSLVHSSFHVD